jgi:hypothetical protein
MKLPSIAYPTYEITGAITKTKIQYRPFLTGEEKILYLAMRSEDNEQIKNAVLKVLNACIITPGIKAETLPVFDLEKLFLSVRAKAIGEVIDLKIPCDVEKPEDEIMYVDVKLLIDDVEVKIPDGHTNVIKVTDNVTIIMNYPGLQDFLEANFIDTTTEKNMFDITKSCIGQLIVEDQVYNFADVSDVEKEEFINTLPTKIFEKISNFFSNLPTLYFDVVVQHPVTGKETTRRLEGITDFFS